MDLARARLYAHTLVHLRPEQVLGRLWRAVHSPKPDRSPAPARRPAQSWCPGARREPSWLAPDRHRYLGEERKVSTASSWSDPQASHLWLYNLHYFDDLCASGAPARLDWHRAVIQRWIEENPAGEGPGWEPYPLSLRLVNWVRWSLAGNELPGPALHSLAVQARYLRDSLEHHLLGNHLLANAKALVFAGCFFDGPEAEAWLRTGLSILDRELEEQVLPDGGHFERSPMYHSLILEDLLDLLNLSRTFPETLGGDAAGRIEDWRRIAMRMRRWLVRMCHPDGQLALFNDCAHDIAPPPDELERYARRLGLGPIPLPSPGLEVLGESGFVRLESEEAVAFLDVGELGPSYLPGHAHADTLSFELSVAGSRVVVNGGTSLYAEGPERLRQRGTAAHSTVQVDGLDSSEVWASFRVARRAHPLDLLVEETGGELRVRCSHDGYRRLPGHVLHTRGWTLSTGTLLVHDQLSGRFEHAEARLHLHPAVLTPDPGHLVLPCGRALGVVATGASARLQPSTWHPRFGASLPSTQLSMPLSGSTLTTCLRW